MTMFDHNKRAPSASRNYQQQRRPHSFKGTSANYTIGNASPEPMNHGINSFMRDTTSVADEGDAGLRHGADYGLPQGVMVPGTVHDGLLQGDVLLALQRMPVDQITVAFTQYDYQIKKRGTFIRNKRGYLMGIINSGPKFGLPQGVIIPPCLTPAMVQGEILEQLLTMPVYQINITLGDYDEQMRKKGSMIRNKQAYFLGVVKKKKKEFEQAPLYDQQNLHNQDHQQDYYMPQNPPPSMMPMMSPKPERNFQAPQAQLPAQPEGEQGEEELDETLHLLSDSLERVRLLTESLGKVTNELVAERENRDALEALIKSEQEFRKATEDNLIKAVEDLAQEKDHREVDRANFEALLTKEQGEKGEIAKELEAIRTQVQEEVELRKQAEEKLLMLEEILISERNVRDEERHVAIPDFSERSAGWT